MKRYLLLTAAFLVIFAACSSIRVSQDYDAATDFDALKRFAWQFESQPKTGDARLDDQFANNRIRTAVEQTLLAAGYSRAQKTSADFLLAYHLGIQRKIQSSGPSTGVGLGVGRSGRYGSIGFSTGSDVESYDEGLLVLDVLAPDGKTLLWRGKGTRTVDVHAKPEKKTKHIQAMVEKILKQFPPTAK